ncbi:MAG: GrdX family protein [Bacillota bacterium]|nr:GrdX family protein [Eubacteriales bacterium]MDD3537681.1 GrdX family protein [Eubacteriales bacterium]MDD4286557.1 GrdX family protein [Eubacteriales bacterium]MDI9492545.1 GrdX family protein [Bacillota bacterium]NLV70481.1 GrdX protein [Clostridiales bacterium]
MIITNNPLVRSTYENAHGVLFVEGNYRDVLVQVRDLVHRRHHLITHPMMGSLKPNETPYRSVIVSDDPQKNVDVDSVLIIEEAILVFDRFIKTARSDRGTGSTEKMKEDFREIDLSLLGSALNK